MSQVINRKRCALILALAMSIAPAAMAAESQGLENGDMNLNKDVAILKTTDSSIITTSSIVTASMLEADLVAIGSEIKDKYTEGTTIGQLENLVNEALNKKEAYQGKIEAAEAVDKETKEDDIHVIDIRVILKNAKFDDDKTQKDFKLGEFKILSGSSTSGTDTESGEGSNTGSSSSSSSKSSSKSKTVTKSTKPLTSDKSSTNTDTNASKVNAQGNISIDTSITMAPNNKHCKGVLKSSNSRMQGVDIVNGMKQTFKPRPSNVDQQVYVPVRYLQAVLGLKDSQIKWNAAKKAVTINFSSECVITFNVDNKGTECHLGEGKTWLSISAINKIAEQIGLVYVDYDTTTGQCGFYLQ